MPLHCKVLFVARSSEGSQLFVRSSIDYSSDMCPVNGCFRARSANDRRQPDKEVGERDQVENHIPEHIAQGSQVLTNVHLQRYSLE